MKVGGKAMLVCPADLAYGDKGRAMIPGGAALTFEVELVEIMLLAKNLKPARRYREPGFPDTDAETAEVMGMFL